MKNKHIKYLVFFAAIILVLAGFIKASNPNSSDKTMAYSGAGLESTNSTVQVPSYLINNCTPGSYQECKCIPNKEDSDVINEPEIDIGKSDDQIRSYDKILSGFGNLPSILPTPMQAPIPDWVKEIFGEPTYKSDTLPSQINPKPVIPSPTVNSKKKDAWAWLKEYRIWEPPGGGLWWYLGRRFGWLQ